MRILFLVQALTLTALAAEKQREAEVDKVREVAFKSLIYNAAASQHGYKVYFLSLGSTWTNNARFDIDPSDEFMSRFRGRTPSVKKASQAKIGDLAVIDKTTGQRGVVFTLSDLKWISDQAVEVTCNVYMAGLSSYTSKYTLSRKKNQWKVTDRKFVNIS